MKNKSNINKTQIIKKSVASDINLTMEKETPIVRIKDLVLSRGKMKILKSLSFDIPSKMVTAFVGSNGAGKTTVIESILGFAHYESGMIEIDGVDARSALARTGVIYVPEKNSCSGISARTLLLNAIKFNAKINPTSDTNIETRNPDELINGLCQELLFPLDCLDNNVESLSTGQQKQLMLIRSFLFKAKLYIFDEPTGNLDPIIALVFYRFLKKIKDTAFFISSHNLHEISHFADYIVIIDNGELKYTGRAEGQSFIELFAKIKNVGYALDVLDQKKSKR
jgi:ABC-type multidrug transport system ATPase subunit